MNARFTDELDLAAVATAAGCARMFARLTLAGWGASKVLEDAQLVVSELITSAVKATGITEPKPAWGALTSLNLLTVRLTGLEASVIVEVWDAGPDEPKVLQAAPDDEGGRGLAIVDQLASRWGARHHHLGGKVVWAELPIYAWDLRELPGRSGPTAVPALSKAVNWLPPDRQLLEHVVSGLQEL